MIESRITDAAKTASPEDTRGRIIGAAREVISRKGKRGATTREIADVAGVNEATLFRHFGTKDALMLAVARKSCPDAQLSSLVETLQGPIEEDLYAMAMAMTESLESMGDLVRWSLVEVDYDKSLFAQETWRPNIAIRSVVEQYMESQVAAGRITGKPEDLASIFMSTIFARSIARDKYPELRFYNDNQYALRCFIDVFLNGVRS